MPITLYRRHLKGCDVHKLGLPARAKRGYAECECPVWVYGRTDTTLIPRQSTGRTDMAAAEAYRNALAAQGKDEQVHGPRLDDCINTYIASRAHEIGEKTSGQYKLLLGKLRDYFAARAVYFIRELSVDGLETFKTEGLPGLADTSRGTATAKLKCFLREALRREWITQPLADQVKPHQAVYDPKSPYTDDEVDAILNGVAKLNGGTHGYAKHSRTFRLLLELMLKTGMRVGDAVVYDPARAVKGETLWIYSYEPKKQRRIQQTKKTIEAYVADALKTAIDGCTWLSLQLPFAFGDPSDPSYLANQVYERMQTIGARVGVADCRPHRLRDTFAVRTLLRGISLDDLSRLLGHSSVKVTEMYYAKWIPARGQRLERLVAESLVDTKGDGLRDRKRNVRALARGGGKARHVRIIAKKVADRRRRIAP